MNLNLINRTKRGVTIVALLSSILVARAQDTLDHWTDTALKNNPELRSAHKKWDAAKQKAPQASALDDPTIGADVERDSTRFNGYNDVEWMISQKIPWPTKLRARKSVAALEAEVVGFKYLEQSRKLEAAVKQAYWELWLQEAALQVSRDNKTLLQQLVEASRARYETGQGSQADLLRAQVELSKLDNELTTQERELVVAQAAINKLLNDPTKTPRHVGAPKELPRMNKSLDDLQGQARKYCCILISFLRQIEAREASMRVAKLAYAPDIEFRVEARSFNGRSGIQEYDTGVFLNFPWLWTGKRRAGVREAQAELDSARSEFENEVNATFFEIQEQHTRADSALQRLKLYEEKLLPQSRQLVESTRSAHQVGRATLLELIDATRTWRDMQLESYRARAQYGKDYARLQQNIEPWGLREFATGLVTPDMN